jgi:hypothetical protein
MLLSTKPGTSAGGSRRSGEGRFYGRSDIPAIACKVDSLKVVAKPILPDNPNHADIEGYPAKKEDQKSLAQKLAASASKRVDPP